VRVLVIWWKMLSFLYKKRAGESGFCTGWLCSGWSVATTSFAHAILWDSTINSGTNSEHALQRTKCARQSPSFTGVPSFRFVSWDMNSISTGLLADRIAAIVSS
jgi:hypothetical protein